MVKHIIILALCLIFYIIGNIDSVTAGGEGQNHALNDANRKQQFERAVTCYRQMFENGLIRAVLNLCELNTDPFQKVLTKFYNSYSIDTVEDKKDEIVPTVDNEQFKNDELFDSFRRDFINNFLQKGDQDEFQDQIHALHNKFKRGELDDYPLKTFVFNYEPDNETVFLRTTSAFCYKYSACPTFEDALKAPERKGKFALAVRCYRQMFENGLIKGKSEEGDTFQNIIKRFYQSYKIETVNDENGEIVPTVNNTQFETDEALASFRKDFLNYFLQKGNQEEFQAQIDVLKDKLQEFVFDNYPLVMFVLYYSPTSKVGEFFKTTSAFCTKFSIGPEP